MKILMNIMTEFHLIFVHLIDSKFAHCDDKAESTDDKNDDGNEATMEILVTFIIAQYVRLHSDPYPGNLFPTLPNITTPRLTHCRSSPRVGLNWLNNPHRVTPL